MKKKLLLLLLTSFVIACSSDSASDDSSNSSSSNRIKKIEEIQNGLVIKTSEYEYNSSGNVSKVTVKDQAKFYETTFNYDSTNKMISWNLKEYYTSSPSDVIEQLNSLEYTNGLITNICIDRKEKESGYVTNSIDRISQTYSNFGLTSIKHYIPITGDDDAVCSDVSDVGNEEFFQYSNGNLIRYEAPGTGFSDEYYKIEHDEGNHYLSGVKPDAFRYCYGSQVSVNNLKKINIYDSYTDKLTATVQFENTYDKNKNIIKAVEKYYYADTTTPSTTTTMNYYYY
ncbi:hypothetical protein [Flavobacterium sp. CF136]|uniref:hypothetical protein n=1 Tax=Flavobacterium sp. (strain CF136) TaxID=1144313 RepID=UPI000271630D|nr:hypothetical protein [Flavobacterium sp. CF136]EJL64973.1 hypothetical protein PMI10_01523 [Flavobacterium sp. CF136]